MATIEASRTAGRAAGSMPAHASETAYPGTGVATDGMSATTAERGETTGFVAEMLRRPIEEAVREGVDEALREQKVTTRERPQGRSSDEGGRSVGRLVLLGLIGLGAAYVAMRRRRSGSGGGLDRTTSEIREQSKTATTPAQPDVGGEASVETMEEGMEDEEDTAQGATPGAGNEDD